MIRTLKFLALAILAVTAISCITTTVQTNKDPAGAKPLEKIYVVVDTGSYAKIGTYFRDGLQKAFVDSKIPVKALLLTGIELGVDKVKKDIAAYGAREVMTVVLDEVTTRNPNIFELAGGETRPVIGARLTLTIVNGLDKENAIWKGVVDIPQGGTIDENRVNDAVDKVFSAMKTDGLILQEKGGA